MRKKMTKQVTKTTVKIAKLEMKDGLPVAKEVEDEILLGNVTLEKAQRIMEKKHQGVTVLQVITTSDVYEMDVEEFIKLATIKEEVNENQETEV